MRNVTIVVTASVLLLGCTSGPKSGFVADQWSASMSELNIFPIFPPREDVHVGDMYLYWQAPENAANNRKVRRPMIWVDSLLGDPNASFTTVSDFYKGRPDFPATVQKPPTEAGKDGAAMPEATTPNDLFAGGVPHRLRLVEFPAFSIASGTSGELSGGAPLGIVETTFGASAATSHAVSVSIPSGAAGSYALPSRRVEALLNSYCTAGGARNFNDALKRMGEMMHGPGAEGHATLMVVTEVFYTRALDYVVDASSSLALGVSAQIAKLDNLRKTIAALEAGKVTPPPQAPAPQAPTPGQPTAEVDARIAAAKAELARLEAEIGASVVPGIRGRLASVSQHGIKLDATFTRPVAIGYRGLTYRLPAGQPDAAATCQDKPLSICQLDSDNAAQPQPTMAPTLAYRPVMPEAVFFDTASATLRPDAMEAVRRTATALHILPKATIRLVGHTDATGSPRYNRALAQRRAEAVRDALMAHGIAGDRIAITVAPPPAAATAAADRSKERRVDMMIQQQ